MNRFYTGALLVVLSALGYGLMPVFARQAYGYGITVSSLLFLRFALAAVIFFIYILLASKGIKIRMRELLPLFILGGVCYTLQSTFYFTAVKYISAPLTVLILYTYPMFVTGLSFALGREKPGKWVVAAVALCFAGLLIMVLDSFNGVNSYGMLLALLAAFVYSVYVVYGNHVVKQLSPMAVSAYITLFASLGTLMTGLASKSISFDFKPAALIPVAAISLFSTVISVFAFFKGMERLDASKASVLSMTEPLFTVIFSALFLNEGLTTRQVFGGVIVMAGAFLVAGGRKKVAG